MGFGLDDLGSLFEDVAPAAADAVGVSTTGVPWGSLASAGMSLLGTSMTNSANAGSAAQAQAASAAEAQKNRDWQERMSNTSYQRGVKDLLSAGLSPMLAYSQGGASTPSGATGIGYQTQYQNALSNAVQSYNQTRSTEADASLKKQQEAVASTSAALANAQIANVEQNTATGRANEALLNAETLNKALQGKLYSAQITAALSQAAGTDAARARDKSLQPLWEVLGRLTNYFSSNSGELTSAISSGVKLKKRENPTNITIYGDSK